MSVAALIIDDEVAIRQLLRVMLHDFGYMIYEAGTGQEGITMASALHPDVILLDIGLPDMKGTDVLQQIRQTSAVPIIMLTVHDDQHQKVLALDQGADDYVTKPFGEQELMARIRVALRHRQVMSAPTVVRVGDLVLDLVQHRVERNGTVIHLTPIEYELLRVLAINAGRVVTHTQLLREAWHEATYQNDGHYLRIYIGHLRKKIEADPTRPHYIITEPGVGYRLMEPDTEG
ncbi:MAG: DNA-binding response regulator [Sulfobacillus thermosulfidooxidans]|uniref:response regulator n=1 Tax=Sulfobacillus TaxID=28033 RepID=UPI000CD0F601|nr:response regulator [Sulfobacillus sp. hq2]MCY0907425.1 response regulator [Sulfobacillus thermotolerans]POB09084.1 DNA-binding response regulator [Sulfobacillus sp. hq2]PSR37425.1 MAG: DNA-binding response regulator [Sulfobacillus thermosulfidooxidans]